MIDIDDTYFGGNSDDSENPSLYQSQAVLTTSLVGINVSEKRECESKDNKEVVEEQSGTIISAIFNLLNGSMGAGVFGIPYSFMCAGAVFGTGLAITLFILTIIGLHVLMSSNFRGRKKGFQTIQKCVQHHMGYFWKVFVEIVLLLNVSGVLIVNFMLVSEFIQPVLVELIGDSIFITNHVFISFFFGVVVIFPLVLLREIKSLGMTSFFGVVFCSLLALLMIINGIFFISSDEPSAPGVKKFFVINSSFYPHSRYPVLFLAFPIQCFGLICHGMIFPIAYEIKKSNIQKMDIVIFTTIFIVSIIYLTAGIFGFLTFGTDTKGNILENFSGRFLPANMIRFLMGLVITFSFAVQNYSGRLAIQTLFFRKKMDTFSFLVIQTLYFFLCLLISTLVPGIIVVISYVGAFGASILMFLFPSALSFIRMRELCLKRKYCGCICNCIFGSMLLLAFLILIFTGLIAAIFKTLEALNIEM